jgi:hypothetical protein
MVGVRGFSLSLRLRCESVSSRFRRSAGRRNALNPESAPRPPLGQPFPRSERCIGYLSPAQNS